MPQDYLRKVERSARDALIQTGAVTPCERHKAALLHNESRVVEHVVYNLAAVWLKQKGVGFMREDLQDAIRGLLDGAAKDGCPECAQPKNS